MLDNEQIFFDGMAVQEGGGSGGGGLVTTMFEPLKSAQRLDERRMNDNLSQEEYKNITPWRALVEVIAIPIVMMTFIIAFRFNLFIKIFLIFLIIVHIIISTCLVSYLARQAKQGGCGNLQQQQTQMLIQTNTK